MSRFVLLEKFCLDSGYTVKAVRRKLDRGDWVEGVQFERQGDTNIKIDTEAVGLWARGVPNHVILEWKRAEIRSVYASITAAAAPKRSGSRLLPQT
jgi:hypothetical protein